MKKQMMPWAVVLVAAPLWLLSNACTKDNPIYCDDSGACPDGTACAIDKNVCSDDSFTLDRAQFFDDGLRLWSTTSNPILTGTTDQTSAIIQVLRGDQIIATPAVIDGAGTWSLQLPAGTIGESDTELKIHLVGQEGTLEFSYKFALDDKPPTLAIVPSSVIDESKDVVTFNDIGEPAHAHQNFPVILDGTHCASIVKYGYLFDTAPPMYGTEDQRNHMAWTLQLGVKVALDETKSRYRTVKLNAGTQIDWSPFEAIKTADGYTVTTPISRDTGPNMGEDGDFTIEWEVYDWAGRMIKGQGCWQQTLLAAPLRAPKPGLSRAAPKGIGSWLLANVPPLSLLINGAMPMDVFEATVTNATAEDVVVSAALVVPITRLTRGVTIANTRPIAGDGDPNGTDCNQANNSDFCRTGTAPANVTTTATLDIATAWRIEVQDSAGQTLPGCTDIAEVQCLLPKRGVDEQPKKYRMVATLLALPQLPAWAGPTAERPGFQGYAAGYTGPALTPFVRCKTFDIVPVGNTGRFNKFCVASHSWNQHTLLQRVLLQVGSPPNIDAQLGGAGFNVRTGQTASALRFPPVAVSGITVRAIVWDAGTY